jgi:flagellar hook-associated protein 2
MGTTSNSIFNGTSRYSSDFQSVIQRAVAIASLPITQLNNQKTDLTNQSTALSGLDAKFQALVTALNGIDSALGSGSLVADISDPSQLTVSLGTGATEGAYSLNIVDAGTYATSLTKNTWNVGGNPTLELVFNGVSHPLTPADYTAGGVAAAINSTYGDSVRATVVNVGTGDAPDYRISLQGVPLGDLQPDLLADGVSQQDQKVPGRVAQYIVNNASLTPVQSTTRTVPVSDGVTFTIQPGASGSVDVTVSRSTAALGNSVTAFVGAYNAAFDALQAQRGQAGGALAGNQVVQNLAQALSSISTYSSGSGTIVSLASLGLDLGKDGHITFDASGLEDAWNANSTALASFFGSTAAGGFLQAASDSLNMVVGSETSLLAAAESSVQTEITNTTNRISEQQERVDQMEKQLAEQMSAADALIASLEQQYSYITGMFQAMDTAAREYSQ